MELATNLNMGLQTSNIGNPTLNFTFDSGAAFFGALVPALVNTGFTVGIIFFVFNLIMGGVKWTSVGGDKSHLEVARTQVTHAIIGIFVLLSLYAIVSLVEYFFGVDLTLFDLQSLRLNMGAGSVPLPPCGPGTGNPC